MLIPIEEHNPVRKKAVAIKGLIIANSLFFAIEIFTLVFLPPESISKLTHTFGMVPANFKEYSLLTSMFLHASLIHLLVNMYFLKMVGDNVEEVIGPYLFLAAYFLGGIFAAVAEYASSTSAALPYGGASGAVSAIMGVYLIYFPNVRFKLYLYFKKWRVRAYTAIGAWFILQLCMGLVFEGFGRSEDTGVSFWAHVGGFVFGLGGGCLLRYAGVQREKRYVKRCQKCDHTMDEWVKFCGKCGAKQTSRNKTKKVACDYCGYGNVQENRFCEGCGNELDIGLFKPAK